MILPLSFKQLIIHIKEKCTKKKKLQNVDHLMKTASEIEYAHRHHGKLILLPLVTVEKVNKFSREEKKKRMVSRSFDK